MGSIIQQPQRPDIPYESHWLLCFISICHLWMFAKSPQCAYKTRLALALYPPFAFGLFSIIRCFAIKDTLVWGQTCRELQIRDVSMVLAATQRQACIVMKIMGSVWNTTVSTITGSSSQTQESFLRLKENAKSQANRSQHSEIFFHHPKDASWLLFSDQ